MKVLFFMLIFLSFSASANEKMLCSILYSPYAVKQVKDVKLDKAKHCAVSCILNLYCPVTEVYSLGLLKELADLMGLGTPDLKDIEANKIGLSFASTGSASDALECKQLCLDFDWRQL